ncbi:DUF1905 domain-containing protein [Spongiivirga sp. MCCC 1A20706]|uniref:DUF1905 domain-containing protein n=1 Tax=Spongiivirga sp. MCCC 1A20706 TaxID=3160963 RepID=UPI0039779FEC
MQAVSVNIKGVPYQFSATVWQHSPNGGWWFVSLPKPISTEIRNLFKKEEEGWGRLKVTALIGKTEWNTAVWFDSKANTYLLPLKAEIRKKESILINKEISAKIWV